MILRDGCTHGVVEQMQTQAELYATIGLHAYEALDRRSFRQSFQPACHNARAAGGSPSI